MRFRVREKADNTTEEECFQTRVINLAELKCPYFSVSQADDLLLTILSDNTTITHTELVLSGHGVRSRSPWMTQIEIYPLCGRKQLNHPGLDLV